LIVLYIGDPISSPESVVGDDDYDTHSTKKHRLSNKILEGALYVMKNNIKIIMIAMNEGETREDAQHHDTMDREDERHVKTLELENRRITSTKKTSCGYIEALKSIGDGLRSISQSFQH
jgi:hypothetical protein